MLRVDAVSQLVAETEPRNKVDAQFFFSPGFHNLAFDR